jgi:hypothetical protein
MGAALVVALTLAGCSAMPSPPGAVGENFPGTCMPPQFAWPSDFLESVPGEVEGVGTIVGLRLEYLDGRWAWRFRSTDSREDMFGEQVNDPSFGREVLRDVATAEIIASQEVELTEAEQNLTKDAYSAAQESGETWPSPLIVEMARVMDDGQAVWQLTMCDTTTTELSIITVR